MKPYIVAPGAEDDLQRIWRYLLDEAGMTTANRIQDELVGAFEDLDVSCLAILVDRSTAGR